MSHVDGNALAGVYSLAFGRDMTAAETTCAECRDRHPMATTHVYLRCPGMVMRCPNCGAIEAVFTEIHGEIKLYVRTIAAIHLS